MASRKHQDELVANPAKHFLQWSNIQTKKVVDGEEYKKITGGEFRYYDKDLINEETGKGTNVSIPMPFEFAILNSDCFSFKGNDKKKNNRYVWSNEANEYSKTIEVKCKEDGSVANLMSFTKEDYKNKTKKEAIKEQLKGFGASYTQSVYISPKTEDGFTEIWNIQLDGGALSGGNGQNFSEVDPEDKYDGWFGFLKQAKLQGKNLLQHVVKVENYKPKERRCQIYDSYL